ncbi:MAG: hypothetical protein LIQ30_08440 [Planctomycetes bacterium]|nr:hypothetical protein [Planctomycetota bacterium]MCD7897052.1 hypothetical protein [Planctomycetaceae bacterium]
MAEDTLPDGASCQPPKDKEPFADSNSEGIRAPSTTAEPLMATEGFVQDGDVQSAGDDSPSRTDGRDKALMYHNDEFHRAVPKQRKWPL